MVGNLLQQQEAMGSRPMGKESYFLVVIQGGGKTLEGKRDHRCCLITYPLIPGMARELTERPTWGRATDISKTD